MGVEHFVAVIGSGPAGMSAAARAAKRGKPHILLERMPHLTHTVFAYPRRKHVMAAPHGLAVRSDIPFDAGTREDVLEQWKHSVADARVNVRYNSDVVAIEGERGRFRITLADGASIAAAHVVVAIGTQGNPRKLDIPGARQGIVQYTLDDPEAHSGETIVVIGGGNSALEDALALAERSDVILVNRGADFRKAKPQNAQRIAVAIAGGSVRAYFNAKPKAIGARHLVLETEDGETLVACDRVIARLGTAPSRAMLEACGVRFSDEGYPALSDAHESNVPGLYVIGALAGFPLIKHGLKQGVEAVEHIIGNRGHATDDRAFLQKLKRAGGADFVARMRQQIPLFGRVGIRPMCEFLLHAKLRRVTPGEIVYRESAYTSQLYWVAEGELTLENAEGARIQIAPGDVAGAVEFCGGQRRCGTVRATVPSLLIEADRVAMSVLFRAAPNLRRAVDDSSIANLIELRLAPGIDAAALADLVRAAKIMRFKAGEALAEEAASDVPMFLIRKGSATLSRARDGTEAILAYLPAGHAAGAFAYLLGYERGPAITAAATTEAICIDGATLRRVLDAAPQLRNRLADAAMRQLGATLFGAQPQGLVRFLLDQGMGEATDALFIDETLCVGCNNCETACAETHGGLSALDRGAGARHGTVHLPNACRHCENPSCMSDCPTNSIRRGPDGAVYIDDTCTGCGNCERNCTYDAIRMAALPEKKTSLLLWLLFGWGKGPGEARSRTEAAEPGNRHAVKCDMCRDRAAPACVSACPTGAAMRVKPAAYIRAALKG